MKFDYMPCLGAALSYLNDHQLSPLALCSPNHDCGDAGKVPHTPGWQGHNVEAASEREIIADFRRLKGNVGIATGLASDIIIIDHDDPKSYQYFCEHFPISPAPPTVQSGREGGGWHTSHLFDAAVDTQVVYIAKYKYEIKSISGQCVAPPSIHAKSGKPYRWIVPFERSILRPIPPEFLAAAENHHVRRAKGKGRQAQRERRDPNHPIEQYNESQAYQDELCAVGWVIDHEAGDIEYWRRPGKDKGHSATFHTKHRTFWVFSSNAQPFTPEKVYFPFSILAILKFGGEAQEHFQQTYQFLCPANPEKISGTAGRTETPRYEDVTLALASSEAPPNPPRVRHSTPPFPESAWRGVFEVYRRAIRDKNEAPEAYHFAMLKSVAGIIMGRTAYLYVGRRIYPNFYSCLIGPTGISRKNTAFDIGIDEVLVPTDPNVIFLAGLATSEGLISKLEVPSATPDAEENDAPKLSLFMQARVDATSANEGFRAIIGLSEYAALLKKSKKSSSDGLIQTLTAAYDCPMTLENPTRHAPLKAVKPCTSIVALSTQEWLEESLDTADIRGGFANRFCYYLYERTQPIPHPSKPDKGDINMVRKHLHDTRAFFAGKHIEFEFDEETYQFVDGWYHDVWNTIANEQSEIVRDAIQRLDSNARKLALLYAVLENAEDDCHIHIDQFRAAVDVATYWKGTALAIFSSFAPNEQAKNENRIVNKLAEKPRTRRQLQQAIGGGNMSAKAFNEALDALYKAQRVQTAHEVYMLV